jgi:hypothetical protein
MVNELLADFFDANELARYSSHWVAIVRGQVSAVAASAREAVVESKNLRLKEEPILIWVPDKNEHPRTPPNVPAK